MHSYANVCKYDAKCESIKVRRCDVLKRSSDIRLSTSSSFLKRAHEIALLERPPNNFWPEALTTTAADAAIDHEE